MIPSSGSLKDEIRRILNTPDISCADVSRIVGLTTDLYAVLATEEKRRRRVFEIHDHAKKYFAASLMREGFDPAIAGAWQLPEPYTDRQKAAAGDRP